MRPFYKRHKNKVIFTIVLFASGLVALVTNKVLSTAYTEVSSQTAISFYVASSLLLATIAMGIYLMVLEYIQVHKKS
ncbi:MAG: hypothetical protein ACE5DM_01735 [Candidatus Nanoarchaeia archaeon]